MRSRAWVAAHPWHATALAAMVALAALHLTALGTAPPGLYNDEASIGYNAWAIAHHGVDEHGFHLPLYFEAFGEWKNPVYVYLLAPFTWVLPLTPATERLPAALCGLALAAVCGMATLRLTGSRAAGLAALVTAGITPWAVVESRVGFEVITMVLALMVALWCLVEVLAHGGGQGWAAGLGIALAVSVFAYSTGRLLVVLLTILLAVVDRRRWLSRRGLWIVFVPVAAAYLLLGVWSRLHPGALTSRFGGLSITADSPGALTTVWRFARNYADYVMPQFLFTHGDTNLRHNTGYGGMLLVATLPALVAGLAVCLRNRRRPLERYLLGGLLLAPVPAALTAEGTPHGLRAAAMLPFLLLLIGVGWSQLIPLLASRRLLAVAAVALVAVETGQYLDDMLAHWPGRSLAWFDSGEEQGVAEAAQLAGGAEVLVSDSLDAAGIQAAFALTPDPRRVVHVDTADGASSVVRILPGDGQGGMQVSSADAMSGAPPGSMLVLAPGDTPPEGATEVREEAVDVAPGDFGLYVSAQHVVLVRIYRR